MLTSILGARLSWHFAGGRVFDPAIVGPDSVDYSLKEGPHAARHAVQRFYYQRVAPGAETTAWYEKSVAVVHMTWTCKHERRTPRCSSCLAGRRHDRVPPAVVGAARRCDCAHEAAPFGVGPSLSRPRSAFPRLARPHHTAATGRHCG
jgi:hypothetical protein